MPDESPTDQTVDAVQPAKPVRDESRRAAETNAVLGAVEAILADITRTVRARAEARRTAEAGRAAAELLRAGPRRDAQP